MKKKSSLLLFTKRNLFVIPLLVSCFLFGQNFKNLGLHSQLTHVQPMTGIVFWADNTADLNTLGDKCQLEYSYLVYSDVISKEGQYDWSSVDKLLENIASRGRQAIFRFRYVYPGITNPSVPDFVRNSSGYTDRTDRVEGSNTYIPDWSSEVLQDFTLDFFEKFAERYDNDTRLAFLQLGFGSYAEYHLWDGPIEIGQTFPSKAYQTVFLNHVNDKFKETPWTISIDAASSEYTPFAQSSALKDLDFGLFDDSFLHETHSQSSSEYNRQCWLEFGKDRAKEHVAGGELNYYSSYDQETVLDPTGPWGTSFEELSELYDISYMIGNDQLNYQSASRIEEAGMNTGYHYKINKFRTNGEVTEVDITNTGLAPIYYDAYLAVDGVRSSESLKGLSKGETKTFTIATVAKNEQLSIECDRLVSSQEIEFDADLEGDILSTDDITKDKLVYAFPNPFEDTLTIENKNNNRVEVVIYNVLGAVVFESVINTKYIVNTSAFQNGIYLARITQDGSSSIKPFVKK